jgi:hypothetical protein
LRAICARFSKRRRHVEPKKLRKWIGLLPNAYDAIEAPYRTHCEQLLETIGRDVAMFFRALVAIQALIAIRYA